jgi:hypothetical protein
MGLIEWRELAANSLWILGCALALAAFSYASWQASLTHQHLLASLESPGILRALSLAGILFCSGRMALSEPGILTLLWGILALACALPLAQSFRRRNLS